MYHKEFKCKKCNKKVIDYVNSYDTIELALDDKKGISSDKGLHICSRSGILMNMGILELVGFLYYNKE